MRLENISHVKAESGINGFSPSSSDDVPLQQEQAAESNSDDRANNTEEQGGEPAHLYALLVGIDNYENVNKLKGCVNDVKQVEKYLTNRTIFNLELDGKPSGKIKSIVDEEATRQGIIDGFREHLNRAGKEDTVLFYYSGHGTREVAAPVWGESTGMLECLVCYDGKSEKSSEFLLADKELRFLIHELYEKTGAHIVVVTDNCHAHGATRNAGYATATRQDIRERRYTRPDGRAFPMRDWSEFFFSDVLNQVQASGRLPVDFLPESRHIQLAACESDQTALEEAGEGVFTRTLLKTLIDSGGNISYNTLRSRIRQYMRVGYEQTPRVYASVDPEEALEAGVFNKQIVSDQVISEAIYNPRTGWQLSVGAIHGVDVNTKITLLDPNDASTSYAASIVSGGVLVDYSKIWTNANLDKNKVYKAQVAGLMTQELIVEIQNHTGNPKHVEEAMVALQQSAKGAFSFGGEMGLLGKAGYEAKDNGAPQQADYTLHVQDGEWYVTRPADPYRPLIRPMLMTDADQTGLLRTLQHISRWHFIEKLRNPVAPYGFPEQPLGIELVQVYSNGTSEPIDTLGGIATLQYELLGRVWRGAIQIKVTNNTEQDLYICAAYLSKEFQCFLRFLPELVKKVEARKSVLLGPNGRDTINLLFGKVEQEYNWPQTEEAIKFIVSTEYFDAEALVLEALPQPLTTDDIGMKGLDIGDGNSRGLDTGINFNGWVTQTLRLVFINPVFNQLSSDTLRALLEWEETAYFASGLYCDVELDQFGQPTILKLKEEIDRGLKVPDDKKSLVSDVKLWLGNQIESAQRRKRYRNLKKDKTRLRIVAEGDSWFQYPLLVEDTLDHLYKLYAIKSFAKAGDTLENYMKNRDYLDAIGEESAEIFLVSGGGNDILGSQFEGFLRDAPDPADSTFQKYYNQNLTDKLNAIEGYYEDMFEELLTRYPYLHILVHGYDYVIPLDTTDPANRKKSSWLGQYLVKKNIQPQFEREQCIHYIMNEFNDRLKGVVQKINDKFSDDTNDQRVTYIDVRNFVNRTSWFDEIHPTNEGFQLVANQFIEEIEKIRSKD